MWGECVDIYGYIQYKYGTYKLEPLYYFQYESPATCQIFFFVLNHLQLLNIFQTCITFLPKKHPILVNSLFNRL